MKAPNSDRNSDIGTPRRVLSDCPGEALCLECFWSSPNGGHCAGCDSDYYRRCLKQICDFTCNTCSGGRHAYTPGCCGRAPASWRERWDRLLQGSVRDYAPAPLQISCRLIPVIHSVKKYRIPEQFPQIDAWAVPIHKVANRAGRFRSNDLKDYLGLPPDRKLILSTCAPDDYQELLWEKGPQMNYEQHGIDYWFPGHFSIYDDDSKLYQFASAKRQQSHAISTESQFVWFRLGEHIPIEFLRPLRGASSVLISTNQAYSARNRAILHNEVQVADSWFPPETAFFVAGGRRHLPISNERTCFEINTNWLMRALRGRNLARQKDDNLSIGELLTRNLEEVLRYVHSDLS